MLQKQEETQHAKTLVLIDEQSKKYDALMAKELTKLENSIKNIHEEEIGNIKAESYHESLKRMNAYKAVQSSKLAALISERTLAAAHKLRTGDFKAYKYFLCTFPMSLPPFPFFHACTQILSHSPTFSFSFLAMTALEAEHDAKMVASRTERLKDLNDISVKTEAMGIILKEVYIYVLI